MTKEEYDKNAEAEEEEEDEEESEEDEEEEDEEWEELNDLDEIDEMEDGPSTFFMGGFSIANRLSEILNVVQYEQDRILIFPGMYGLTRDTKDDEVIELDEARLKGLHIEGVPFSLGKKGGYPVNAKLPKVNRRVGPWFMYYAAAQAANGEGGGMEEAKLSTTMTSSVYGATVTPTKAESADYPVLTAKLVLKYTGHPSDEPVVAAAAPVQAAAATTATDAASTVAPEQPPAEDGAPEALVDEAMVEGDVVAEGAAEAVEEDAQPTDAPTEITETAAPTDEAEAALQGAENAATMEAAAPPVPPPARRPPLKFYEQESDEDEEEDEGGAEETESPAKTGRDDEAEDDEEGEEGEQAAVTTITIEGLAVLGGVVFDPLTRGAVRHCVLGIPSSVLPEHPISSTTTVVGHPLSDGVLENCVIYGSRKHALYAYPRCGLVIRSCIFDGPSLSATMIHTANQSRPVRHGHSLALLEFRAKQRATGLLNATHGDIPRLMEPLADFEVPESTACEVGIFCDDADILLQDCGISNTRLGLLLHEGCKGVRVFACDVRSVQEVGIYFYGIGGCSKVWQSVVASCGRECLLVRGPTEAQVAAAELQFKVEHKVKDYISPEEEEEEMEENGGDEDEDEDGNVPSKHPTFAQHPSIKQCSFTGTVRVQSDVRSGAFVDNLVFRPQTKEEAAAAAAQAAKARRNMNATFSATSISMVSTSVSVAADGSAMPGAPNPGSDLILAPNYGVKGQWTVHGFRYGGLEGMRHAAHDN